MPVHRPGDREHAGRDRHHEQLRIEPELPDDDVLDHVIPDLLVGTLEDAEHVGPADDPAQPAGVVDHRQALDPAGLHAPRGLDHSSPLQSTARVGPALEL